MKSCVNLIEVVDEPDVDIRIFKRKISACIILTKDKKILLQKRGNNFSSFPGYISTFGGGIEEGETSIQALVREIREELGAVINPLDVHSFGAIVEAITGYTELLYVYYWYDRRGAISGCFEGEPIYFDNVDDISKHPQVMEYVHWLSQKCKDLGLLK